MSTRCNVLVTDEYSKQWFYRHSDGYPSCTAESLKKFIQYIEDNKIRPSVSQGSPWLIVLGHNEYAEDEGTTTADPSGGAFGWKVGAYELTNEKHGDIEWLYTINLKDKKITVESIYGEKKKTMSFKQFLKSKSENLEKSLRGY